MNKKTIVILFGGVSSEHDISCISAYNVAKVIDKNKYKTLMIKIYENGRWMLIDNLEKMLDKECVGDEVFIDQTFKTATKKLEYDLVWPIFHGKNGEDGSIQGLLELLGIPYVGCDILASALCMDKYKAHQLAKVNNIKVTKSKLIKKSDNNLELSDLKLPVYVKPVKCGSSIGISKIESRDNLVKAIDYAFQYDDMVVVEQQIKGYEVGCAIVGNEQNIFVSKPDQVLLENEFFDYKIKYQSQQAVFSINPDFTQELSNKIQQVALKVYQALGCKDYARVDLFVDENEDIYFNEVNTIPGMTTKSLFPQMLMQEHKSYSEILDQIIATKI